MRQALDNNYSTIQHLAINIIPDSKETKGVPATHSEKRLGWVSDRLTSTTLAVLYSTVG